MTPAKTPSRPHWRSLLLSFCLVAALLGLAVVYWDSARLALLARDSTEQLQRNAVRNPGDLLLVRAAAERLLAEGRPAEARELLAGPAQAHPGEIDLQILSARALLDTSETAAAGALLQRVLQERPGHPQARFWLAEVLYQQGHEQAARDLYEEVTVLQPGFGRAWERAGELRLKSEHFAEALKRLNQAERLQPTATVARLRGAVLRSLGRTAEAEEAVRQALARHPNDPLAHYALADLLQSRPGDASLPEARDHLERAVRLDPTPDNLKLLAVVQRRQGDLRGAVATLRRMIEMTPAATEAYLLLGQSYQALGRRDLAAKVLAIYHRLEPLEKKVSRAVYRVNITRGDPAAQIQLVRTYLAVGRQDLARATLEKLRRRDPSLAALPELERQARGEPTLRIPPLPPDPEAPSS